MKIAVSGKGGTGKTTTAALLARTFMQRGFKVLAIDADPNTTLAFSLGITPEEADKIIPISENSNLIEEKTGVKPSSYGSLFRLSFRVDDIVQKFSVESPVGVPLLVMGAVRSAGQGCMCPANTLIRALLRHLLTKREEVVVVDMVAGVEHLGRGTVKHIDVMLIVCEPNLKSLETAKRIFKLSKEMGLRNIFSIGNKVCDDTDGQRIQQYCQKNKIPLLGLIPYDEEIKRTDATGETVIDISNPTIGVKSIIQIGEQLLEKVQ
jgi:CO dehydrogenase maturation factor